MNRMSGSLVCFNFNYSLFIVNQNANTHSCKHTCIHSHTHTHSPHILTILLVYHCFYYTKYEPHTTYNFSIQKNRRKKCIFIRLYVSSAIDFYASKPNQWKIVSITYSRYWILLSPTFIWIGRFMMVTHNIVKHLSHSQSSHIEDILSIHTQMTMITIIMHYHYRMPNDIDGATNNS